MDEQQWEYASYHGGNVLGQCSWWTEQGVVIGSSPHDLLKKIGKTVRGYNSRETLFNILSGEGWELVGVVSKNPAEFIFRRRVKP